MGNEAVSYNLHHALHRKNHKKNVLYLLLQEKKDHQVNNKEKCIDVDPLSLKGPLRISGYQKSFELLFNIEKKKTMIEIIIKREVIAAIRL